MGDLFWKIYTIMNECKGFSVGYSTKDEKMLFDFNGKRYVAEFREVENPAEDPIDDMRRIKYL
jgi:hypothetical protein